MKRSRFGNEETSREAEPLVDRGRGNWMEVDLLVQLFVCLLALVPGKNT